MFNANLVNILSRDMNLLKQVSKLKTACHKVILMVPRSEQLQVKSGDVTQSD